VDLEYFVNDLRHKEHDVVIFMYANQNDRRCYRPQGHDNNFKSDGGFNIDGCIDGSLKTFLENTGLYKALNNKHGMENAPPTHEPGSTVIDYVLVLEGLLPHIKSIGMLSQDAVFTSDHRAFFVDLDAASYFGHETDAMPEKKLRQLQLDDPRISDEYRKQLHRLFTGHNIYRQVKTTMEENKTGEFSLNDEGEYEKVDRDITRSMLSAAKKYGN
jgi:hypothetical protein